jgi:DNA anti-recombination protein RmuC
MIDWSVWMSETSHGIAKFSFDLVSKLGCRFETAEDVQRQLDGMDDDIQTMITALNEGRGS